MKIKNATESFQIFKKAPYGSRIFKMPPMVFEYLKCHVMVFGVFGVLGVLGVPGVLGVLGAFGILGVLGVLG